MRPARSDLVASHVGDGEEPRYVGVDAATGSSSVNSVFRVDGKGRFHHQEMPVVGFESFTVEQFVGTWAADELS